MTDETDSMMPIKLPQEKIIQSEQPVPVVDDARLVFPPIASFWRRLFAWAVDIILLGILGQILGFIFSDFLFSIGPYGRPLGLLIVLPYFGLMNSKYGGGQTVGKRWLKIAVRNARNEPIELWRSVVRICILMLPNLFNGWQLPEFQNKFMLWFFSLWIFGLGGAILYTMVFNFKARQGLHDMLLGTYVVHLDGITLESFPTTARVHKIISGGLIGLTAISTLIMMLVSQAFGTNSLFASEQNLYEILAKDPRFFTVSVLNNISIFNGKSSHNLIITVWVKGKPAAEEQDALIKSVVKTALTNHPDIKEFDAIRVTIRSAYDICIASAYSSYSYSETLQYWQKVVFPDGFTFQWNGAFPYKDALRNVFSLSAVGR